MFVPKRAMGFCLRPLGLLLLAQLSAGFDASTHTHHNVLRDDGSYFRPSVLREDKSGDNQPSGSATCDAIYGVLGGLVLLATVWYVYRANDSADEKKAGLDESAFIFSLMKDMLGAGILTLADGVTAARDLPWAVVLLWFCLAVNCLGYVMVGEVCQATGAKSYREAWDLTVGPRFSIMVDIIICLHSAFTLLAYGLLIKQWLSNAVTAILTRHGVIKMQDGLPDYPDGPPWWLTIDKDDTPDAAVTDWKLAQWIPLVLCGVCVLAPLALRKNLKALALAAVIGMTCVGLTLVFLLWQVSLHWSVPIRNRECLPLNMTSEGGCTSWDLMRANYASDHLSSIKYPAPSFDGMVTLAALAAGSGPHCNAAQRCTEYSGARPLWHPTVVGYGIVLALFTTYGLVGFLRFGTGKPKGNILKYFSLKSDYGMTEYEEAWSVTIWVVMAFNIMLSYPFKMVPMRVALLGFAGKTVDTVTYQTYAALTLGIVFLLGLISLYVDSLTAVWTYKGAVAGSTAHFIFPAIMQMYSSKLQSGKWKVAGYVLLIFGALYAAKKLHGEIVSYTSTEDEAE